jgi:hypothetical protein
MKLRHGICFVGPARQRIGKRNKIMSDVRGQRVRRKSMSVEVALPTARELANAIVAEAESMATRAGSLAEANLTWDNLKHMSAENSSPAADALMTAGMQLIAGAKVLYKRTRVSFQQSDSQAKRGALVRS